MRVEYIKPQMVPFVFRVPQCVGVLASGRLLDLGYAAGHSFFEMSCSFWYHAWQDCTFLHRRRRSPSLPRNMQFMKVSRLFSQADKNDVCLLPVRLDEQVARFRHRHRVFLRISFFSLKRIWDQKLSSYLMSHTFMTNHLFQFCFADAEQCWLITLTCSRKQ